MCTIILTPLMVHRLQLLEVSSSTMKPNLNVIPLVVMVTVGGQFAFRLIALYIRTRVRFSHVMSISNTISDRFMYRTIFWEIL